MDFLKKVREKVVRLFFLLNKVDYLSEREREAAVQFLRVVLKEQVGIRDDTPVFCVSARAGLEARQSATPASGQRAAWPRWKGT